jgi:aryl-alcohol dehydrogenase-like predicted oxidoreductase
MKHRNLAGTDLSLSEVGFGVWSVSTNWWGEVREEDGISLLKKAFEKGITFFDTADSYGEGYGEEMLGKALGNRRKEIVIGTKFGYDLDAPREARHQERPQDWSPAFVKAACDKSLARLQTDYIDLYQMHNSRLTAIQRDDTVAALDDLRDAGKIRHWGVAVGPDIGWIEEGEYTLRNRKVPAQIIYSVLEQDPADRFITAATESNVGVFCRVPHASGMLDGTYTKDTELDTMPFDADDHRSYRRMQWLKQSIEKLRKIDFLIAGKSATVGQIAIKFCLTPPIMASCVPTITNEQKLDEYVAAPDTDELPVAELENLSVLYADNFGVGDKDPMKSSQSPTGWVNTENSPVERHVPARR